jgi:hypothetical protein
MNPSRQVATTPDWFDVFWEQQKNKLPVYLRNDATRTLARGMVNASIQAAAQYAGTPPGVRALVAFARITAVLRGTAGVLDAPNPSPEEIATAVERLVQRVKA